MSWRWRFVCSSDEPNNRAERPKRRLGTTAGCLCELRWTNAVSDRDRTRANARREPNDGTNFEKKISVVSDYNDGSTWYSKSLSRTANGCRSIILSRSSWRLSNSQSLIDEKSERRGSWPSDCRWLLLYPPSKSGWSISMGIFMKRFSSSSKDSLKDVSSNKVFTSRCSPWTSPWSVTNLAEKHRSIG